MQVQSSLRQDRGDTTSVRRLYDAESCTSLLRFGLIFGQFMMERPRLPHNIGNNTRQMIEKFAARTPALKALMQQHGDHEVDEDGTGAQESLPSSSSPSQTSTGKWIKELSSMSNVVVGRCAR